MGLNEHAMIQSQTLNECALILDIQTDNFQTVIDFLVSQIFFHPVRFEKYVKLEILIPNKYTLSRVFCNLNSLIDVQSLLREKSYKTKILRNRK